MPDLPTVDGAVGSTTSELRLTFPAVDEPFDPASPTPDPTFSMVTLETIEREIEGVAHAIETIDNGTYGSCEHCGNEISPDRLRTDPLLVRCDAHLVLERPELFADELAGDAADGTQVVAFA